MVEQFADWLIRVQYFIWFVIEGKDPEAREDKERPLISFQRVLP